MRVVGATADQSLFDLELGDAFAPEMIDDLLDFGHNLRADSIAGEKKELQRLHVHSRCVQDGAAHVLDDFP